MKVAFVVATTAGGTGRHVSHLAAGCAARGVSAVVFGPTTAGDAHRFDACGATFVPVDIGTGPSPARDAGTAARLRRLLGRSDPDVVHAHGLRAGALTAVALRGVSALGAAPAPGGGHRRGRPRPAAGPRRPALVVTVHNAPPGGRAGAVYRLLEAVVARSAAVVLCVSPDLAARLRRAGAHDVRPAVVPAVGGEGSGTPVVDRAAVRAEFGADAVVPGRPVVLAAGRLTPQKGFDVLLAAAARWRDLRPTPLLVLAGEGPSAASLAAAATELGDAVRMVGHRDDLPALVAAADLVVVPSRWEGQPLFVQEALRAGRPLVAARVGGIPDLTGEDAAVLVPPEDPDRLAAAVRGVLADPALARRLARAAAARGRELPSGRDAVDAALAVYRSLAGSGGAGSGNLS